MFDKKQIELMKKMNLNINFEDPTDDDINRIENKLSKFIQTKGFDKDYNPTKECIICESILDLINDMF